MRKYRTPASTRVMFWALVAVLAFIVLLLLID